MLFSYKQFVKMIKQNGLVIRLEDPGKKYNMSLIKQIVFLSKKPFDEYIFIIAM